MSEGPNAAPSGGTAPGWYPDPWGQAGQRWWDGNQWTQQTQGGAVGGGAGGDTGMAQASHLLGLFTGFVGPLIIWLTKGKESAFVEHHAKEALNFQIMIAIAMFVSFLLAFVLIGFLLIPIVFVVDVIFCIQQTMAAGRGEQSRYPLSLRLIS